MGKPQLNIFYGPFYKYPHSKKPSFSFFSLLAMQGCRQPLPFVQLESLLLTVDLICGPHRAARRDPVSPTAADQSCVSQCVGVLIRSSAVTAACAAVESAGNGRGPSVAAPGGVAQRDLF